MFLFLGKLSFLPGIKSILAAKCGDKGLLLEENGYFQGFLNSWASRKVKINNNTGYIY